MIMSALLFCVVSFLTSFGLLVRSSSFREVVVEFVGRGV